MQAGAGDGGPAVSAPGLIPVGDLAGFLAGSWRVRKFGWDGVLGRAMRFAGGAVFEPRGNGLHFEERGALAFGSYRGDAVRRYVFQPDGPAADVLFEDGRFFHHVNLVAGADRVRHDCAPDLYDGRYRILGPNVWMVTWRITGPRKRQVIASRFDRAGVARGL